jgi:hypothetical protein
VGLAFLPFIDNFKLSVFGNILIRAAFRFTDEQEYTDQRVHCINDIHPSIHVFVFFEGRVFDICFGEAGGVGWGYGWF